MRTHFLATLIKRSQRTGLPLWLEIVLILLIKIAILFGLWKAFFSHPQTKHMALPLPIVEQHFLTPSTSISAPKIPSPSHNEAPHGSD
jgi:hypothetical protein